MSILQGHLLAEQELKDHDSVFRELRGTAVHYKLAQGIDSALPVAIHCYHGFGANTFSWSYVYKALSEQLHAQVTKHDMPGFGLTQRPSDIDGYSLDFNGRLGRLVMDAELAAAGILDSSELDSDIGPGVRLEDLQSVSKEYQSGQGESEVAATTSDINTAAAMSNSQPLTTESPGTIQPSSNIQSDADTSDNQSPSFRAESNASAGQHDSSGLESPISSRTSWDSVSSSDSNRYLSREQSSAASSSNQNPVSKDQQQQSIKRVLIGHSLGASCAAAEIIKNPKVWQALSVM